MFDRNISDGQKVVEADPSELDGLPQDYIDRHKPGADGKIRITTDYPDALPVFSFAKSDSLRRRVAAGLRHPRLSQEPGSAHQPAEDALRDRHAARLFQLGRLQRRRQDDRQGPQHRRLHPAGQRRRPPAGRSANSKCCWPRSRRPIPAQRKSGTTKALISPN